MTAATAPGSKARRRRAFPLHEVHVARFGASARATAHAACALPSLSSALLPRTEMHPAFVYTAPAPPASPSSSTSLVTTSMAAGSTNNSSGNGYGMSSADLDATGPATLLASLSPSFQPVSCHVSPVRPLVPATSSTAQYSRATASPIAGARDIASSTGSPRQSQQQQQQSGSSTSLASLGARSLPVDSDLGGGLAAAPVAPYLALTATATSSPLGAAAMDAALTSSVAPIAATGPADASAVPTVIYTPSTSPTGSTNPLAAAVAAATSVTSGSPLMARAASARGIVRAASAPIAVEATWAATVAAAGGARSSIGGTASSSPPMMHPAGILASSPRYQTSAAAATSLSSPNLSFHATSPIPIRAAGASPITLPSSPFGPSSVPIAPSSFGGTRRTVSSGTSALSTVPHPRTHVVTVSSNNHLLCTIAGDGYWNTVEVPLGNVQTGYEAVAVHAYERVPVVNFAAVVKGKARSAREAKRGGGSIVAAVAFREEDQAGSTSEPKSALHVYGALTVGSSIERKLFGLVNDVQVIPIDYAPMQIGHIEIHTETHEPLALVVSDQRGQIHLYGESTSNRKFIKLAIKDHFPLLPQIDMPLTVFAIHELDQIRLFALGYASGEVHIVVDIRNEATHIFERSQQYMLPYLYLYTPITSLTFLDRQGHPLQLVITPSAEPTLVVTLPSAATLAAGNLAPDIGDDPATVQELPQSDVFDTVLCSRVMPVLWNGRAQVLLGTYGQRILLFDCDPTTGDWELVAVKKMAYPVHNLVCSDLTGDGVRELVVISMFCVHVLQYDMKKVERHVAKVLAKKKKKVKVLN
ncbi:hypothetical protein BC828DRAFT_408132 [Blastocladiella britannica]|nr:hypothetical protein BC828DRAFT_408132 [Blastocladiella britannica]